MRIRNKLLAALAISMLTITACGGSEDTASEDVIAEGEATDEGGEAAVDSGDTSVDVAVETDEDGNPIEATQAVGMQRAYFSTKAGETEEETKSTYVPIINTELGDWTKTKNGFMFRSRETGEWVKDSVIYLDAYIYYFDPNGYLQDEVFIPADDGTTRFVQGYQFVNGFVEQGKYTYYVDAERGRLEGIKASIEGETWCFDDEGKSISEEDWDEEYIYKPQRMAALAELLAQPETDADGNIIETEPIETESAEESAEDSGEYTGKPKRNWDELNFEDEED